MLQNLKMKMEICKEFEMKLHLKFIENCTERNFLTPMKNVCISKEIPRVWRVGKSKITYKLQFSVECPQLQSFPDSI